MIFFSKKNFEKFFCRFLCHRNRKGLLKKPQINFFACNINNKIVRLLRFTYVRKPVRRSLRKRLRKRNQPGLSFIFQNQDIPLAKLFKDFFSEFFFNFFFFFFEKKNVSPNQDQNLNKNVVSFLTVVGRIVVHFSKNSVLLSK